MALHAPTLPRHRTTLSSCPSRMAALVQGWQGGSPACYATPCEPAHDNGCAGTGWLGSSVRLPGQHFRLDVWDAQHVRAGGRLPRQSTPGSPLTDCFPCRLPLCGVLGPKAPRPCAMPAVSTRTCLCHQAASQGFNGCQCSALIVPQAAQHLSELAISCCTCGWLPAPSLPHQSQSLFW